MKAIRVHIKQNSANYRREETVNCRSTYPMAPYSTVIGAFHKACGYTSYHPMKLSIQGRYGSLRTKMFKEDCFLNSLQDDRNTLVKMKNPDMLSSAYQVVAIAQKSQGNSFEKGITINVVNEKLIREYRLLKRTKKRIDKHKKRINQMNSTLKEMKADSNISPEEVKAFESRYKRLKEIYSEYERVKYTVPYSHFRTLAKGPKYYELLCDIELVIHIVSDEQTMRDIMDNICNLTAIGRGEDFVEVLECEETELCPVDTDIDFDDNAFDMYMPIEYIEQNKENLDIASDTTGGYRGGTKYLMPKDYTTQKIKGGMRKREFNRIPVIYNKFSYLDKGCSGILIDKTDDTLYPVLLA